MEKSIVEIKELYAVLMQLFKLQCAMLILHRKINKPCLPDKCNVRSRVTRMPHEHCLPVTEKHYLAANRGIVVYNIKLC